MDPPLPEPVEPARRIAVSFGALSVGKVLGDLATFTLFILLSRRFGPEGIGVYSFAIAVTGIAAVFSELGLNTYTVRQASAGGEPISRLLGRVFSFRLIAIAVSYLLLLLALPFLPFPGETLFVIAVIGIYQICYQTLMGFGSVFLALGRAPAAAALEASFKTLTAAAGIAILLAGGGLVKTMSALSAAAVPATLIALALVVRAYGRPLLRWGIGRAGETAREALPYGLYVVLVQIQLRIDVTLLGLMAGAVTAGVYNVAYRPVFFLFSAGHFLAYSILPVASDLYSRSEKHLRSLYRQSLNLAVLIAIPGAAGLALVAHPLIHLLFGDEFRSSVVILQILALLFLLSFPRYIVGAHLTACGLQKERAKSQGWAVLAALALYPPLISSYGPIGAAVAAVIVEVVLVTLLTWKLRPVLGWPHVAERALIAAAGTVCFVAAFAVVRTDSLAFLILGSSLIYLGVVSLFPQVRSNELALVMRLIRRPARP